MGTVGLTCLVGGQSGGRVDGNWNPWWVSDACGEKENSRA